MASAEIVPVGGGDEGPQAALASEVQGFLADGLHREAYQAADAGLRRATEAGDAPGQARAQLLRATVLSSAEDVNLEVALEVARAAVAAFQALGDSQGTLEALQTQLRIVLSHQQHDSAVQLSKDMVMHCSKTGDRVEGAAANFALAEAALAIGDTDTALQAARQAAEFYDRPGMPGGRISCALLLSKIFIASKEFDAGIEESRKAQRLAAECGDRRSEGGALTELAKAHAGAGESVDALRAAEAAARCGVVARDPGVETEALVIASDAKTSIAEERTGDITYCAQGVLMKDAEFALSMARAHKSKDQSIMALALLTHGRALLLGKALKGAFLSAKASARAFRKVGDNYGRARALLVWSAADLHLGYLQEARTTVEAAFAIFDAAGDSGGKQKAFDLSEQVSVAMGLPTQAELAERERQQQAMLLQQQQMMMQMQMQQMGGAGGQLITAPAGGGDMPDAVATQGQAAPAARDGSALDLKKGLDVQVIRDKIMEIAGHIIGDADGFDLDLPLMEAGLTSNSAVLLRDELTKDLPGVKLPPTLIFDYPSVGAIADFVKESSG